MLVFSAARLSSAARLVSVTLTLLLLAAFSGAVFGFAEAFPSALPAAALPATALTVRPGLAPTFRAADEDLLLEAPVPFPTDEDLSVRAPAPPAVSLSAGLSCPALAASC